MRTVKDADVRKQEILDAAETLFNSNGFDATTISDIINSVGVARGTIYYHFKSKEDILDALIRRQEAQLLAAARLVAADKSIPVLERLVKAVMAMNCDKEGTSEITRQMHKPQNALMHQKSHQAMIEGVPPVLMEIIEEGIAEGLFNTPYPYESLEMIIAHTNTVFDDYTENLTQEELLRKVKAFIFNLERLFGAKSGSLDGVMEIFQMKRNDTHE